MSPERSTTIEGHLIEEFHWAGKMVVYIDGHLTDLPYGDACYWAQEGDL